ncbi:MAG: septum formation inhibitor Maf [Gammaproteobacteria bacterium]|nr:MAG: septum formation inhibitor Maf [Gammaproteobacteria bacterium]
MISPQLLLASRSPRRQALLTQIGVRFHCCPVDIDEQRELAESPLEYVRRMAAAKAEAVLEAGTPNGLPILGADTAVVLEDDVLGKPRDATHAQALLMRLSGRSHQVLSAVAVAVGGPHIQVRVSVSEVWFRPVTESECVAYCATGEPLDKAGGYAIQGQAAIFVERLVGSYSGVMGLPLFETAELLSAADVAVFGVVQ